MKTKSVKCSRGHRLGLNDWGRRCPECLLLYKEFDDSHRYGFKRDRLYLARRLGYTYISEATVELYYKYKSATIVGRVLGLTGQGVMFELHKMRKAGIDIKIQMRGGDNRSLPEVRREKCSQ